MNELELKYGCNPNQKPSRIYMEDGSELPIKVLNGRPGYTGAGCAAAFPAWAGRGGGAGSSFGVRPALLPPSPEPDRRWPRGSPAFGDRAGAGLRAGCSRTSEAGPDCPHAR